MKDLGFENGLIIARNQVTGLALADQYQYQWRPEIGNERPGLIVNVTPIGMIGGKEANDLPFSDRVVESAQFIFDVVAIPAETPLIKLARALKKPTISGSDVIVLQAVEQFVLYTGTRPDLDAIRRAAIYARA